MEEFLFRFVAGGIVVSAFAMSGDLLKPKSFAGLLGAAPSVALATLTLTVLKDGVQYAATEARSMIPGAVAFGLYAALASRLMMRSRRPTLFLVTLLLSVWMVAALGLWRLLLG